MTLLVTSWLSHWVSKGSLQLLQSGCHSAAATPQSRAPSTAAAAAFRLKRQFLIKTTLKSKWMKMQINHEYALLSDSSLISAFSCYSLNPCFCSRSWSFYFCCWQLVMFSWKFEILLKPVYSQGLCTVFYNEFHLAFHCTACCLIALQTETLLDITYHIFNVIVIYDSDIENMESFIQRSRRVKERWLIWLLVVGGDSKTFA